MSIWNNLLPSFISGTSAVLSNYGHRTQYNIVNDSINLGGWGQGYNKKHYNLSLRVSAIDEAITIMSEAFSSGVPYMQDENGELSQDSALIDFLLKPNKHQNFKELSKEFIRNLHASGFSYLLPHSESDANLRRIDKLDSDMRPELLVLNTDCIEYYDTYFFGLIDKRNKFKYHVNGSNAIDLEFDNIIPFWDKNQHPDNPRIGVSRLHALKDQINNVCLADQAKTHKIKQSGKFLVTPGSKNQNNTFSNQMDQPVNMEKPDYKQKDLLEDKLQGSGLASGKSITVFREELQTLNLMETIQNYSYDEEVKEDRRTIKNVLRIPKELQNIGDDAAKYENRKEGFLELFTLSVMPLSVNFCESIQNYYDPNEKRKLILDYSHHPAFEIVQAKKEVGIKEQTQLLMDLFDKQVISQAELKKKLVENGTI